MSDKPRTHCGNLSHLPRALTTLTGEKRWVNWRWESRKGKWTKPPLQPNTLCYARNNDPATWNEYDRAVCRWRDGDADGIGYMLLDSSVAAIDLDRCCQRDAENHKTRTTEQWARELREGANGAYCEVTVSGRGLRLIGTTHGGGKVHRRFNLAGGGGIELFRRAERFITISGLRLGDCTQLVSIDGIIDSVLARYARPHDAFSGQHQQKTSGTEYDFLIRCGAEKGQRSDAFHRLVWHLANNGWSIGQITQELAKYPTGIATKYLPDRLDEEVSRSYAKWQQRNPPGSLPTIEVVEGQIARMVDETQDALVQAQLGILVRGGGVLVEPLKRNREAADGRKTTATLLVPVTPERMTYLLNKQVVQFARHDGRDGWRAINPPAAVVKTLLVLGTWQFPDVVGVIGTPTLRPDGSILSQRGYDPATRLWCDSTIELPNIPERPTRRGAEAAVQLYAELLAEFPFVGPVDRTVAVCAILTMRWRRCFWSRRTT